MKSIVLSLSLLLATAAHAAKVRFVPSDMVVWLPQKDVLFACDIVHVDPLLAVLPVSTRHWLAAFARMVRLPPATMMRPG